jgi:ATP-dependent RNA helicase DDX51/DBP6
VYDVVEAHPSTGFQSKTTAKKRYLKRKKQHRKHRKPTPATTTKPAKSQDIADEYSEDETDSSVESVAKIPVSPTGSAPEPPPTKRLQSSSDSSDEDEDDYESEAAQSHIDQLKRRSPTPPVSLSVFPLPTVPDAPSKSTLALQGLDKGILEAEYVDPATTLTLFEDNNADKLGLSEKMKRRLKDLGISELFAGKFCTAFASCY